MMFGWIITLPLLLIAIWYFNRSKTDDSSTKEEKSLDILKKCFATWEIHSQEFENKVPIRKIKRIKTLFICRF